MQQPLAHPTKTWQHPSRKAVAAFGRAFNKSPPHCNQNPRQAHTNAHYRPGFEWCTLLKHAAIQAQL